MDLGLLENTASGSSHSTSLSPAPQFPQGGADSLANGKCPNLHSRTMLPWQLPTREGQGGSTCSYVESPSSSKRRPPPVKPKPRNHSLRQETHSPPADTGSSAELTNSEKSQSSKSPPPSFSPLPHQTVTAPPPGLSASIATPSEEGYTRVAHITPPSHAKRGHLRRSRSVEAFCFLPLGLAGSPAGERGSRRRASHTATGSLPELATPTALLASPAVDEDDYTLPVHLLPHPRHSPQPYLQPQSLYSYAYSHTMRTLATKYQSLPHGAKPAPVVKERCQSESSNPYESIRSNLTRPRLNGMKEGEEPDYDEIFSDTDIQSPEPRGPSPSAPVKNTPTSSAQTTPTSSAHATPTPTPRALVLVPRENPEKQRSIEPCTHRQRRPQHVSCSAGPAPPASASPGQRMKLRSILSSPASHGPRAPLTAPQRHSSTTSEGYVNDDEFPRPPVPPCYPTPPSSATLPTSQPTLQRYTKLNSHLMEEDATYDTPQSSTLDLGSLVSPAEQDYDHLEEGGNYDRLESSSSSSSHH